MPCRRKRRRGKPGNNSPRKARNGLTVFDRRSKRGRLHKVLCSLPLEDEATIIFRRASSLVSKPVYGNVIHAGAGCPDDDHELEARATFYPVDSGMACAERGDHLVTLLRGHLREDRQTQAMFGGVFRARKSARRQAQVGMHFLQVKRHRIIDHAGHAGFFQPRL